MIVRRSGTVKHLDRPLDSLADEESPVRSRFCGPQRSLEEKFARVSPSVVFVVKTRSMTAFERAAEAAGYECAGREAVLRDASLVAIRSAPRGASESVPP
jgi:hypothetical protein